MNIVFTLSMPSNNSWNGKWSGESKVYAIVKKFTGKKGESRAAELLRVGYWSYNFGDGWGAGVTAKQMEGTELRAYKKRIAGFCGYDWMVDRILSHGRIIADHQLAELNQAALAQP